MTIPLYTLLFPYLIFLTIFTVFFLINIYHISMSASLTLVSFFVTFFVFATSAFTLYGVWVWLGTVNWQQPLLQIGTLNLGI